jgi:hypothetical protein
VDLSHSTVGNHLRNPRAYLAILCLLIACSGGSGQRAVEPTPLASCPPGALEFLRHAAVVAKQGLENGVPTLRELFLEGLRGHKRASGGTARKFPIRGVFDQAAQTLEGNLKTLTRALSLTEGCGFAR